MLDKIILCRQLNILFSVTGLQIDKEKKEKKKVWILGPNLHFLNQQIFKILEI